LVEVACAVLAVVGWRGGVRHELGCGPRAHRRRRWRRHGRWWRGGWWRRRQRRRTGGQQGRNRQTGPAQRGCLGGVGAAWGGGVVSGAHAFLSTVPAQPYRGADGVYVRKRTRCQSLRPILGGP